VLDRLASLDNIQEKTQDGGMKNTTNFQINPREEHYTQRYQEKGRMGTLQCSVNSHNNFV
jgi:hypothetical protein